MKFNEQETNLLKGLKEEPADPACLRDSGILYWNTLEENAVQCVHEKLDLKSFLTQEKDFVNFGMTPEALENIPAITASIAANSPANSTIKIYLMDEWLLDVYTKIMSGDKKEALEKEIKQTEVLSKRLENDILTLQKQRRDDCLASLFKEGVPVKIPAPLQSNIDKMEHIDKIFRLTTKIKKTISKGAFLSVKDRRNYCEQEKEYAALMESNEKFLSTVDARETIAAIKRHTANIHDCVIKIIDGEDHVAKKLQDIADLSKKQQEISPLEVEANVRKELEYVRELVKLTAKRLHCESCSMVRGDDKYFTLSELHLCIDRVIEFDPAIFNNSRAPIFGIPSVLLVPCNGNAVYDWKNNLIIVPLVPPSAGFMASIAYGMIEYRLDVDEDKQLLASYNELPQHKDVKSIFNLKIDLTKDYITWMTSEYKGYKVLPKEVRKWFEHEIAPNKNEMAVPLELRTFILGGEAFTKKCKDSEALIAEDLSACPETVLWEGGILNFHLGKFERSLDLLKALIKKNPTHATGLFNAAQACIKLMRKQEAIDYFNEFYKLKPQSWWAGVAQEHVRRLQTGHSS